MLCIYAVNTTTTPSLTTACIPEQTPILSPSCTAQGTHASSIILVAHHFSLMNNYKPHFPFLYWTFQESTTMHQSYISLFLFAGMTFTEIIMMTSTVTVSVTPTPTNVLNSGTLQWRCVLNFKCTQYLRIQCLFVSEPTTCLNMQKSSTQVVSVKAAVLVGWAVAASILLV